VSELRQRPARGRRDAHRDLQPHPRPEVTMKKKLKAALAAWLTGLLVPESAGIDPEPSGDF
jgi:hypothetical protein